MMSNASFEKKTLYGAILSLILGLILVVYPFFILADSFVEETFNSYSNGSLTGQGDWVAHSGQSAWIVQDDGVYSYTGKSVRCQESTASCGNDLSFISTPSGTISFWLYEKSVSGRSCRQNGVMLDENSFTSPAIYFMVFWNTITSKCELRLHQSYGATIIDDNFTDFDTLFRVDLEWDFYTQKVRARANGSNWTEWVNPGYGGWTTGLNSLKLHSDLQNKGDSYIDQITSGAGCSPGNCSYCLTGESCLANNCIWEYNTAFERWECHKEWTPYVPGCGTGFQESCYGCYTQETCETAIPTGVCEWVDRGYGTACYPTEEIPEEVEWEMPDLENCEGLGTIETWLCEIKNFFTGLFMPTQEKVNNLKSTLDNFKTKFPFNYANSMSVFFDNIKKSFETEKEIPIKILGVESNVDFSFWDQNTTIGGVSETLKNVLFDASTGFVIIAFAFWIISFIKRIF